MTEVLLMYVTKKIAYLKKIGMNIINLFTNKMRKAVIDCQFWTGILTENLEEGEKFVIACVIN